MKNAHDKLYQIACCVLAVINVEIQKWQHHLVLIIYFHHNKQIRQYFWLFLVLSLCFISALVVPHLLTEHAREMLFNNPNAVETIFQEMGKIGNNEILLLPVLYSLLMLAIWHMTRLNLGLLVNLLCIMFISISFVSNTSPGWFVWGIPFLVCFFAEFTFKDKIVMCIFFGILFVNILFLGPLGLYDKHFFSETSLHLHILGNRNPHKESL